ncbi:O-antigen ligase family protein [Arabiibacter massiliensis]|uniref:O-antigen ligase family protein n=1 Tax=Arabiibacter massiliensis TaxID=1870985 RepID=UPI00155AFC9F|nr:O-antigen ligase family protein [Arabiibacter massiliensis]
MIERLSKSNAFLTWMNRVVFIYVVSMVFCRLLYLTFPFAFLLVEYRFNVVSEVLGAFGVLLLIVDLLTTRRCLEKRYSRWLVYIVITLTVSSLCLFRFGSAVDAGSSIVANAKIILWQIDQMLVIFPFCASMQKPQIKKMTRILFWLVSIAFIPCLIVSLYQYGFSIGYDAIYGPSFTATRQGFQGGRLFGLMMGAFAAGTMSMLLSAASIYFAVRAKMIGGKVLYSILGLIYALYAILSGTRSVFVALIAASFIFAFLLLSYRGRKKGKARYLVSAMTLSLAICLGVSCVYLVAGNLLQMIPEGNAAEQSASAKNKNNPDDSSSKTFVLYDPSGGKDKSSYPIVASYLDGKLMLGLVEGSNPPFDERSLDYFKGLDGATFVNIHDNPDYSSSLTTRRSDVGESAEASNGRIPIWRDYLTIATGSIGNALIGLSPGGYMPVIYSQYESENLYIIDYIEENYPEMIEQGLIYDVHNGYLGILVQSGLIGFVLVFIFLYRLISDALRAYFHREALDASLLVMISALAFILVAVFFDSDLFFRMTSTSVVFWMLGGFIASNSEVRESRRAKTMR